MAVDRSSPFACVAWQAALEYGTSDRRKDTSAGRQQLAIAPRALVHQSGATAGDGHKSSAGRAQPKQCPSLHGIECCIIGWKAVRDGQLALLMTQEANASILKDLAAVNAERQARVGDAGFAARVEAVKRYQQRRFELTYADLLAHPRYAGAANFFLNELYGPSDFTQRDAQFARIVPALVRLFPTEVVGTVQALAALHALSEQLDSRMGKAVTDADIDARQYAQAWQRCGDAPGRERQIALLEQVGHALDALTRNPLLRHSLRLMRGPARAAGMSALHTFLEAGFDTFRGMRGADEFLGLIGSRERALAASLFAARPADAARLGHLP
jgi:hypothetical protein